MIDSLGGIVDTLKPMQETLRQHELRPYTVQRDYRRELSKSQRGGGNTNNFSGSQHSNRHVITDHMNQENVKLVSVSPFRAVVKVEDGIDDDEGDETFEAEPNQQLD